MASDEFSRLPADIQKMLMDGYDVLLKTDVKDGIAMVKALAQKPKVLGRYVIGSKEDLKNRNK